MHAWLRALEAESIHILREVAAGFEKPVMLYSVGKDSGVMVHLARKAFWPGRPPFRFLHIDSTWNFTAVNEHMHRVAAEYGMDLIVHVNQEGVAAGIDPIRSGSNLHAKVMLTDSLKQALDKYGFDCAIGGGRRDEEKSRAKERVFSVRAPGHVWEPRRQRPELWRLYNTRLSRGETVRAFPLSNWTELDIWEYTVAENIPIVPLYLAAPRPVVRRDGQLILREDDRLPLREGEREEMISVRFRSLGDWPLTAAVESEASTLEDILWEVRAATRSERQGRIVDADEAASMERKKREGYF